VVKKLKGREPSGKIGVYGIINFKYRLNKYNERAWTRLISLRAEQKKSSCERNKKYRVP
jgi:hypothetical protein